MAKKEGRISLPRLLRETEEERKHNQLVLFFAIIGAVIISAIVLVNFLPRSPAPAYEFQTGVNHPKELSDLIGHGTVVLFFTEPSDVCPPCANMTPKIAALQSQYSHVTFVTINIYENVTSSNIAKNYGIQWVPKIFVIRSDGAIATFTGEYTDISTVKNAIEDAQNWQQAHPT